MWRPGGTDSNVLVRQSGVGGRGGIFEACEATPTGGTPHTGSGGGGGAESDNGPGCRASGCGASRTCLGNNGGGSGNLLVRFKS